MRERMDVPTAERPLVSVIITSYNYARYIGEAIESVWAQTYSPIEIIVVDDGSTDDTRAVLAPYADAGVTCIFQENEGKSGALNRGLAASQGEFIAFLDSDDAWLPDAVEWRMALFDADPLVGVVYARALVVDANGVLQAYQLGAPERYAGDTVRSLLCGVFIHFVTFMVRRTSLEAVGAAFDPAFGAANDWEMYLRLARVCRFAFLAEPMARYRVHGTNWSRNAGAVNAEILRLVHLTLRRDTMSAIPPAHRAIALRNLYTIVALGYLSIGDRRRGLPYLAHALVHAPHPLWALVRVAYLIVCGKAAHISWAYWIVQSIAHAKERYNARAAGRGVQRWQISR